MNQHMAQPYIAIKIAFRFSSYSGFVIKPFLRRSFNSINRRVVGVSALGDLVASLCDCGTGTMTDGATGVGAEVVCVGSGGGEAVGTGGAGVGKVACGACI